MSNSIKGAMRVALRASSRAIVRPRLSPHSALLDQRYRMQVRQVEEMMGLGTYKKEGAVSQVVGCIGGLLGFGLALMFLFHVLARV